MNEQTKNIEIRISTYSYWIGVWKFGIATHLDLPKLLVLKIHQFAVKTDGFYLSLQRSDMSIEWR